MPPRLRDREASRPASGRASACRRARAWRDRPSPWRSRPRPSCPHRGSPARPGLAACRRQSRCGSTSSGSRLSPSSEALNSGNFFSVATAALIMKASMLTLTPLFSFSLFNCTRNASRSVMSASSWLVTCGIITQLRCRFAAGDLLDPRQRLRLRRDRTSRNRPWATAGDRCRRRRHRQALRRMPPSAPWALLWQRSPRPLSGCGPCRRCPVTRPRSTPSSRASLRTPGPA